MQNRKHLEVKLHQASCGHYVNVPKHEEVNINNIPACQICAQKRNEKADNDHARATFIGTLPSCQKKALKDTEELATINS